MSSLGVWEGSKCDDKHKKRGAGFGRNKSLAQKESAVVGVKNAFKKTSFFVFLFFFVQGRFCFFV